MINEIWKAEMHTDLAKLQLHAIIDVWPCPKAIKSSIVCLLFGYV